MMRYYVACVVVGITIVLPLCERLGFEIPSVGAALVTLVVTLAVWAAYKRSEEWQA